MTHYEVLGVSNKATDVEIKRSFRRLSLELHPDRNNGSDEKYHKVVEAYSILGDEEKRRLYDISLKERLQNVKTNSNYNHAPNNMLVSVHRRNHDAMRIREREHQIDDRIYDMSDYDLCNDDDFRFEDYPHNYNSTHGNRIRNHYQTHLHSQSHPHSHPHSQSTQPRLDDIQHTVQITLEESFAGVSLPIKVDRKVNGVSEEALLYVDIPQGTDNGEIVVLEGKGHVDLNLRMRSHVRVKVEMTPHDIFSRDRLNVICKMDITLKEALCGFRKEILHLDGRTYMISSERGKIISQGGRRCITGKGFQRGQTMGNLIIVFNIVMPKSLTMEQIQNISKIL